MGKSSITARLLERLTGYDRLVIYRVLDEDKLLKVLTEQCTSEFGHEILNGKLPLMQRLTKFFQSGLNQKEQRFIFVLDDFEANLELRSDGVEVLKSDVVEVLLALLKALQNSKLPHRIIITCRYDFIFPELNNRLHRENLAALKDADLVKKYQRLESFNGQLEIEKELSEQGKKAADGNPRLLEWLDKILQSSMGREVAEILQKMTEAEEKFRENILAAELLKLQNPGLRKMLGKMLVYELPVPEAAILPLCVDIVDWKNHLERAVSLGLMEVTLINNGERLYRVPRILSPLLDFPEKEQREKLYQEATEILYRLWWSEVETYTEEQKLEIHRLSLLAKNGDIALTISENLANQWRSNSRYREIVKTCLDTLVIIEDYHIFHSLGIAENHIGEVEQAEQHYQQALELCSSNDEQEKASIYHHLGILYANWGDVDDALALFNQSLSIKKRIGNVQGEAATLQCIGTIYANLGNVDDAILSTINLWTSLNALVMSKVKLRLCTNWEYSTRIGGMWMMRSLFSINLCLSKNALVISKEKLRLCNV